jgi:hypothetical protein
MEFTNLKHPIQKFPFRTPLDIVKTIAPIVEGKVVCDIGCGCGDILYEMRNICKQIIGIEHNIVFKKKIDNLGVDRSFIKWGDLFEVRIPEADVYFLWLTSDRNKNKKVIGELKMGSILIDATSGIDLFGNYDDLELLEKLEYEYDETKYNGLSTPKFKNVGIRFVRVYRKNG